eukprot:scaffold47928_cov56-Attheya_sp.AAC.2
MAVTLGGLFLRLGGSSGLVCRVCLDALGWTCWMTWAFIIESLLRKNDALVEVWVVFCDTFVAISGSNQMRRDPTNASLNPVESIPSSTKLPHIRQSCKREARSWENSSDTEDFVASDSSPFPVHNPTISYVCRPFVANVLEKDMQKSDIDECRRATNSREILERRQRQCGQFDFKI